jgi:hypothetical protein
VDAALSVGHRAVTEEVIRLLRHDNAKYPVPGASIEDEGEDDSAMTDDNPRAKKKRKVIKLDKYSTAELDAAKQLVAAEAKAAGAPSLDTLKAQSDVLARVWDSTHSDYMYIPALKRFGHSTKAAPVCAACLQPFGLLFGLAVAAADWCWRNV